MNFSKFKNVLIIFFRITFFLMRFSITFKFQIMIYIFKKSSRKIQKVILTYFKYISFLRVYHTSTFYLYWTGGSKTLWGGMWWKAGIRGEG